MDLHIQPQDRRAKCTPTHGQEVLATVADEPFAALVTSAWTTAAYGYPDRLDHNLSAGEGDAGNVLHDGAGEVQLDAFPVPLIVAPSRYSN